MHNLHASKAATVSVKLLKTSPVNQKLSQMYALQTTTSGLHGQNVLTINNPVLGDTITCLYVAFKKFPDNERERRRDERLGFRRRYRRSIARGGLLANLAQLATNL